MYLHWSHAETTKWIKTILFIIELNAKKSRKITMVNCQGYFSLFCYDLNALSHLVYIYYTTRKLVLVTNKTKSTIFPLQLFHMLCFAHFRTNFKGLINTLSQPNVIYLQYLQYIYNIIVPVLISTMASWRSKEVLPPFLLRFLYQPYLHRAKDLSIHQVNFFTIQCVWIASGIVLGIDKTSIYSFIRFLCICC